MPSRHPAAAEPGCARPGSCVCQSNASPCSHAGLCAGPTGLGRRAGSTQRGTDQTHMQLPQQLAWSLPRPHCLQPPSLNTAMAVSREILSAALCPAARNTIYFCCLSALHRQLLAWEGPWSQQGTCSSTTAVTGVSPNQHPSLRHLLAQRQRQMEGTRHLAKARSRARGEWVNT